MNTHIIILIKDIENRIEQLTQKGIKYLGENHPMAHSSIDGSIKELIAIKNMGKQISLDEKALNEMAQKASTRAFKKSDNSMYFKSATYKDAYKQALKDLL